MTKKDKQLIWEAYTDTPKQKPTSSITLHNLRGTKMGDVYGPQSYEVYQNGNLIGVIGWSGDSWGFMSPKTNTWDWDKSLTTKSKAVKKLISTL
jgi:hypothetical protein